MKKNIQVIIVEDNEGITEVLKIILSEEGYKVITTRNGEEFFNVIQDYDPDIIMLDLRLPGMSGQKIIELLKKKDQYKHKPIIVISASHHLAKKVLEAGASSFIPKPFDIDVLVQTVRKFSKDTV